MKASKARIATRAAELMVERPDRSVDDCIFIAELEERFLYGDPAAPQPIGILNS